MDEIHVALGLLVREETLDRVYELKACEIFINVQVVLLRVVIITCHCGSVETEAGGVQIQGYIKRLRLYKEMHLNLLLKI